MGLRMAFWVIFLVLIVFFGVSLGGPLLYSHYATTGLSFVMLVLIFILGIRVFGRPIEGN